MARLWPLVFDAGLEITFAYTSFKWANLASYNAGVTVVIIGLGRKQAKPLLFEDTGDDAPRQRAVDNICPYLVPFRNILIEPSTDSISPISEMVNGNKPVDGGNLILDASEATQLSSKNRLLNSFVRLFVGAADSIQGKLRYCVWIRDTQRSDAEATPEIAERLERVRVMRTESDKDLTKRCAATPSVSTDTSAW